MQTLHKISQFLQQLFIAEYHRLILWVAPFTMVGSYLFISYFNNFNDSFFGNLLWQIILAFILFIAAIFLYFKNRNHYKSLIFVAVSAVLFGFIYSFCYEKIFNNYTKITGKVFVEVKGKISDIDKFYNSINGHEGLKIKVSNLVFYKPENNSKKQKFKRTKQITEKEIIKNFTNVIGYQDIDHKFLEKQKNYQSINWQKVDNSSELENEGQSNNSENHDEHFLNDENSDEIFPNPPKKILVTAHHVNENLKIGDEILFLALINPSKKPQFIGDFDYGFDARAKGVGGYGYVSGEIEIMKKANNSSFDEFIAKLRKKIQEIIREDLPNESGNVAAALLMGNQNLINKDVMSDIRNSGLAHLISISGLHLSLAAGILFFTFRFLFSFNSYLTTHFDIKKIAAIAAIFSSFFYLKIAGSPVPAVRSFIAVVLVMSAILFDRKVDALRAISFALFVVTLLNPYNIFSISFQLSFAAILALTVFHELWQKLDFVASDGGKIKKCSLYFLEMILISSFTQLANTPFLIYYFSDVAVYGALSNMVAIPLTSFTTMPLGFASFFLMPFGLEKIVLIPMGITIDWVLDISHLVANLNNSHFYLPQMPKFGLALAIIGGAIFCFSSNYLKPLGAFIFLASMLTIFFIKQPNILIDGDARFFAIYSKKNGLVFSKDLRPSKKRDLWMKKMNETEFKSFEDFSDTSLKSSGIDCNNDYCKIIYQNKKLFFVFKRSEIEKFCEEDFDVIVNLTKKYTIPDCINKNSLIIDNVDLLNKGAHFLYFKNNKIEVKSVL